MGLRLRDSTTKYVYMYREGKPPNMNVSDKGDIL